MQKRGGNIEITNTKKKYFDPPEGASPESEVQST
jgi:hypothetical protein